MLSPVGLKDLFDSPNGPMAKNLAQRAIRVESQAKVNASGRPGPRVRTGRLRSSIHWNLVNGPTPAGGELYAKITAATNYARYVELGTSRAPAYPYLRPALTAAR